MKSFSASWFEEIADVSSRAEFQRAVIRLTLPGPGEPVYDWDTGEYEPVEDTVLYEGQARVIGVRWGVGNGGESQANAKTVTAIRVQVPRNAVGRVNTGAVIAVLSSDANPAMVGLQYRVTSDLQGSSAASRTFEASLDGDVVVDA